VLLEKFSVAGWHDHVLRFRPEVSGLPPAGVVGIRDHRLGQVPAAAVQIKPGVAQPTVADLEAHLRQHIYGTHNPMVWRFVDSLPATPSLKPDRSALIRLFEVYAVAS
jgi:long-chain acyl-CoA synthetase